MDQLTRTRLLLGDGVDKLRQKTVAVFGLGGVGGHVVEALARSGIGHLILTDHDTISITNINRQLLATHKTVGMSKVAAAADRVRDIDPTVKITEMETFYGPDTAHLFDFSKESRFFRLFFLCFLKTIEVKSDSVYFALNPISVNCRN